MQWRRTLWLMVLIQAISALSFTLSTPFIPLFIAQLGVHPLSSVGFWAGVVTSINSLSGALVAPLWGSIADRFGRRGMVVRSSVFGSLTSVLMGLSQNLVQLIGARILMGAFGGFAAAAVALVGSQVPEARLGFALGWMATAQMVGTLVGPLIGGFIADQLHDYRAVFFWTAVGTMAAALTCASFVREEFVPPARQTRAARVPLWRQYREIVLHPELTPLFAVLILAQVTTLASVPIVPLFIEQMVGSTSPWLATFAGASFAVTGLADLIASPWLGKRSDVIGYRRVLLISLAGAAVFTLPQAFVHDVWVFLALRFGLGIFLGGILPTANAWIGRLFPAAQRGTVYGLSYSATATGMFLGPLLGGAFAAKFGFPPVFLATGALMLATCAWVATSVRSSVPTIAA